MKGAQGGKVMKLTKREKETRSYILEEYTRIVSYTEKHPEPYAYVMESEVREILGSVLDILGG